jgi:hypothetical protein
LTPISNAATTASSATEGNAVTGDFNFESKGQRRMLMGSIIVVCVIMGISVLGAIGVGIFFGKLGLLQDDDIADEDGFHNEEEEQG